MSINHSGVVSVGAFDHGRKGAAASAVIGSSPLLDRSKRFP